MLSSPLCSFAAILDIHISRFLKVIKHEKHENIAGSVCNRRTVNFDSHRTRVCLWAIMEKHMTSQAA
jgi:cephalosporin-C deacetylase-like acetyl esterase